MNDEDGRMALVSLRIARAADAVELADLTAQLGYDVDAAALGRRLASILTRPDHRFLVAEAESGLLGWLHAAIVEHVETDPFVMIGGLVVRRTSRHRGVGRRLREEAERWAVERGCSIVRLWSSAGRIAAHRFYERLGYANVKTQFSFVKSLAPGGPHALDGFVPRIEPEG